MRSSWSRLSRSAGSWAPGVVAFLFGVAWFFWLGLGEAASPWHVRWTFSEDWSIAELGFLFYKNAPWQFPIGSIPNYFEPFGTTVGYTDGVPSIAPWAKLISPLMPPYFQYIGPYWCFCFGALGAAGERITSLATRDAWQRALGGALFAVSPLTIARLGHPALGAMFVLVLGLYLAQLPSASFAAARRHLAFILLLMAFAAGTHPYLATMSILLLTSAAAMHVFIDRVVPGRWAIAWIASPAVVAVFFFWLYGFIGFQRMERAAAGFGEFAMDLGAFYNPLHHSKLWNGLPILPRASEGFQYLGVGVLALLALRLVTALREARLLRMQLQRHWILMAVVIAMALFALSSTVRLHGVEVLDLRPLYQPVQATASMFRASGRFGWPLHFALLAIAVGGATHIGRGPWAGRAVLCVALFSQVAEAKLPTRLPSRSVFTPMPAQDFELLGADYDRFVFVPIHLQWICRYDETKVQSFAYEASKRRMSMNAAYLGRAVEHADKLCDKHLASYTALDPRAVYVVDDDFRADFDRPDAVCGRRHGWNICVADRPTAFASQLRP